MPLKDDDQLILSQKRQRITIDTVDDDKKGHFFLEDSLLNKGTAFSVEERIKLGIEGLLPITVETIEEQLVRAELQLSLQPTPVKKYIYLNSLKERNETLYYRLAICKMKELLPIIYTPTIGEICQSFSNIFRASQGLFLNITMSGRLVQVLKNIRKKEIDIIVVTDGSRILGLGDLGVGGMGIPIGKLSLYVAAGGFNPARVLPIMIDVGTNNESLLTDPLYLGLKQKRVPLPEYFAFWDEFIEAVRSIWPKSLIQFEDIAADNCFELLRIYRHKFLCFNDDIQGTGAVVLSGFISAMKILKTKLPDQRILLFGAGSAATGVADQIVAYLEKSDPKCATIISNTTTIARRQVYLFDSEGLVISNRTTKIAAHKLPYARDDITSPLKTLKEAIAFVKPTVLFGLSAQYGVFTEEVLSEMAKYVERPVIMPLSNPSSKSECTAEIAIRATKGKCLFASGSPAEPVVFDGKTFIPAQGNNMYIFPGLGLGACVAKAKEITDEMIASAAETLSTLLTEEDIAKGSLYPDISRAREISVNIAAAVMIKAIEQGITSLPNGGGKGMTSDEIKTFVQSNVYYPQYSNYL